MIDNRVALESMTPIKDYHALEQKVRALVQDNDIVEQSVRIVEESRNGAMQVCMCVSE